MNDQHRRFFGASLLTMVESLRTSVTAAGGSAEMFCSVDYLQEASAFDLICTLATNDVRFIYAPRGAPEES